MNNRIALGELCNFSKGYIDVADDTLIDYIDISSVDKDTKSITGFQTLTYAEAPSRARKSVVKNNILVSTVRPNLNAVAIYEQETPNKAVVSTGFCVLECKENVDYRFLFYYCRSKHFIDDMVSQATGASYPAVNEKIVKSAMVPIYSYQEQCKISKELDVISNIISDRYQQLQQLDELVKARFVELFGDPENNPKEWLKEALSNHLNVVGGYAFKSDLFLEEGIPVLRIGNINAGYFQPVNMVYWKYDTNLSRYMVYAGELVMSLTGTVGKDDYGNVCVLGNDYNCYYLNQRNAKLELFQTIDKYYLSQILKFPTIKKKLTGISRGVRQANISNKDILNLEIPIPPVELQNEFADFVKKVDKSKVVVQKALDEAQTLFDSLMQEYFG